MTLLPRAEGDREVMDRADVPPDALRAALQDVAAVNRWLGGRRALLRHLDWALPAGAHRVLDVGTGAADLPMAVVDWARRRGRSVRITAVDRHTGTVAVAASRTAGSPEIRTVQGDGLRLPFRDGAFDLALLSMTLHHMDGAALVCALTELARVARGGRVLVGELERCLPGYLGARFLAATVWRAHPVTRHDGPLSVRRAFTPAELLGLGRRAGLRVPRVQRHRFYRLVLCAEA